MLQASYAELCKTAQQAHFYFLVSVPPKEIIQIYLSVTSKTTVVLIIFSLKALHLLWAAVEGKHIRWAWKQLHNRVDAHRAFEAK